MLGTFLVIGMIQGHYVYLEKLDLYLICIISVMNIYEVVLLNHMRPVVSVSRRISFPSLST